MVSEQASAIGVTAIPTPVTDMASDLWFLHQNMWADESNLTDRTRSASRGSIDSKAMRKVNGDEDIVFVSELGTIPSAGCILGMSGRFLLKLH